MVIVMVLVMVSRSVGKCLESRSVQILILQCVSDLQTPTDQGRHRAANNMCKVRKERAWAWQKPQSELASNYELMLSLSLVLKMVLVLIVGRC